MKKIIYKSFIFSLFITSIISCSDDDTNVFDTSATERITQAVQERKEQLTSATEGWIFEYYPETEQSYGGYSYVVSFDADNQVSVYSERQDDISIPEISSYNVIPVGGPVLTFDTYNAVMHEFSTPNQDEYQAKGGDFEFRLSSESDDIINAVGTISGNELKLIKLTETPQSYLTKVKEVADLIDGASFLRQIDNVLETVESFQRNFIFTGDGEDSGDLQIAYTATDTGIKFYEAITIDGVEITELILDIDARTLTSLDGSLVLYIILPPIDVTLTWLAAARTGYMSQAFVDAFTEAKTLWDPVFGYAYPLSDVFEIGNSNITFAIGTFSAVHGLNFSGVQGEPTQLSITKGESGLNWSFVPMFDPMVDMLVDNSPYIVTIIDDNTSLLTSENDSSFYFYIFK